jgi:hypothetical protein
MYLLFIFVLFIFYFLNALLLAKLNFFICHPLFVVLAKVSKLSLKIIMS